MQLRREKINAETQRTQRSAERETDFYEHNSVNSVYKQKLCASPRLGVSAFVGCVFNCMDSAESLSENTLWREARFGRSAPVLGRSNVTIRDVLERQEAVAYRTLLWPRTATLLTQTFKLALNLRATTSRRRDESLRLWASGRATRHPTRWLLRHQANSA